MSLVIIFALAMALSAAAYLGVQAYFDSRDAGEAHDRLVDSFQAQPGDSDSRSAALFEGEREVRSLGDRVLRRLNVDQRLQQMADQAGVAWAPGQIVLGCLGCAFIGFNLCWYGLAPAFRYLALVVAPASATLPLFYLRRLRRKRIAAFEAQFPDALLFIARAMRAGHAFSVSLDMLQKEFDDPLGAEFRIVFEEQNLGLPMEVALEKLANRMPMLDVRFFVAAVILQKKTGGNLGEILEKLAELIRERFKLRGQIRTISAHGRLSSMVLTAIPIVVAVMMYFVNRPHMMFFADEEIGRWMAGLAVVFVVLGFIIMKQIVKIEV